MRLALVLFCLLNNAAFALDIGNAKRINKTCALCHGLYSQGTPGMMSPRLAGLPASYIEKEMRYYRDGTRDYPAMVVTSQIKSMSDKDIRDISEYLGDMDIREMGLPEIPIHEGNTQAGEQIFGRECKSCHRRTGHGKPEKGIPPIAGQYGSYLLNQIDRFRRKNRFHDDDPEDDTFADFSDTDLNNIIAYVTQLPPHRFIADTDTMLAMAGMAGMQSVKTTPAAESLAPAGSTSKIQPAETDTGIAGSFQVTPTGDIVLQPKHKDIRAIAGLRGTFRITANGEIRFAPDRSSIE